MKHWMYALLLPFAALAAVQGAGAEETKADAKPAVQKREFTIEKQYLNIPVKRGAPARRMRITFPDGKRLEFNICMPGANDQPSFWAPVDLAAFKGKMITFESVDKLPENSTLLERIEQADGIHDAGSLYQEPLRPQFHYSARRGWINDPNGLVYFKGEYHLYYQYNPYKLEGGGTHWGHAVSKDLVHWQELPPAIVPLSPDDIAFSGSCIVDFDNLSGFKTGEEPPIVAAWFSTRRDACIAYSNDRGRTFTEYRENPVVPYVGDPKMIWYAPGKHWVMAVNWKGIAFCTSPDLKKWEQQPNPIGGFFECPELFEICADGDPAKKKWILYSGDGAYSVGDFDGKTFTPDGGKHPYNFGNAYYASQTFNNIPEKDGRRIQIAWGKIDMPEMPFEQCMLFPVELTLHTTEDGLRLFAMPVREIEKLHGKNWDIAAQPLSEAKNPLEKVSSQLADIALEIEPKTASEITLSVRGLPIVYDVQKKELRCMDKVARLSLDKGKLRLRFLVDRQSVEIYANDGRVYVPMNGHLDLDKRDFALSAKGDGGKLISAKAFALNSIWKKK